jgi:CRP-like cAMP-binding protein
VEHKLASLDPFRRNYLVFGLNDHQVAKVADLATEEILASGDPVFTLNEKNTDLFVVLEGHVTVYRSDGEPSEVVRPPGVLGELALVDNEPRCRAAYSDGFTRVARVPVKPLRRLIWDEKDLGIIVIANLARNLGLRLADALLRLDDQTSKAEDPWAKRPD